MSCNVKPLELPAATWTALMLDLRRRGDGCRETGAFLLGREGATARTVGSWLPYDDLDPEASAYDYIRLRTEAFSALWSFCARTGAEVVGDIHTHPLGPTQSPSDRANPMVAIAGHVAIIVPRFAMGDVTPADVSVNVYRGDRRWSSYFGLAAASMIQMR